MSSETAPNLLIRMHFDNLARAAGKAVAFQTALASLSIAMHCAREKLSVWREQAVHGETRNSLVCGFCLLLAGACCLLPTGQYHCTVQHLDGWMALSTGLPHTYKITKCRFHAYKYISFQQICFSWLKCLVAMSCHASVSNFEVQL